MFCPRCGRAVNAEANFCGGCGLSRVEIEKYIKNTAPQQAEAEVKAEEVPAVEIPAYEVPKAETVFCEAETAKEEPVAQPVTEAAQPQVNSNNCTYAYSYKKAEPAQEAPKAEAEFTPVAEKTEKPLSTMDFVWMFLISSLPVIGLVYIIYLAVQNNNINKRSFARATIVVAILMAVLVGMFAVGFAAAGWL